MDFPELPDDLPEGTVRKKWQAFNTIICQAAEPRIEECSIDSAEELAEKIDALRGYEVPSRFRLQKKKKRRKLRRALQLLAAAAAGALTAYWGLYGSTTASIRRRNLPRIFIRISTHPLRKKNPGPDTCW